MTQTPAELAKQWLTTSPFTGLLGLEVIDFEPDIVRVRLPFRNEVVTIGDVVHGGAISSLIDTAAAGAAWSGATEVENLRGTTVSLSVSFLAAARAVDLTAEARCIKRGKSICFCEVDVTDPSGGLVAKGLVTYKIG